MAAFTVPPILKGEKFYKVVSSDENGNVKAECQACTRTGKTNVIRGKYNPSSNFVTHLKRTHPEDYAAYDSSQKEASSDGKKGPKRLKLEFPRTGESSFKTKSELLSAEFVIQTMSPLSIVENPAFVRLVKGLHPGAHVMTRKTLSAKIQQQFSTESERLKERLKNVQNVCITADIWSSRYRSFLGVTCHWIEGFTRISAVLALKRFKGRHNFDRIAEALRSIFDTFELANEKIVSVVTDNGFNFVKAFKEFGIEFEAWPEELLDNDDPEDPLEQCEEWDRLGNEEIILSPHVRCASHTLSLVATKDSLLVSGQGSGSRDAITAYKKMFSSAMSKCAAIWNKVSQSQQINEKIV